jgi:dihydropyrimidinase
MSANPAKIFGMYPRKGTLAPGADADVVLFDPTRENVISAKTSRQRCDYSSFEGVKTRGEAVSVLTRGEWALRNGQIEVQKGAGRFVPRARFTATSELVR